MKKEKLPYDPTPMEHAWPEDADSVAEGINRWGTYNVQATNDTDNFFPAIAQGLPKNADFQIRTKNLPEVAETE